MSGEIDWKVKPQDLSSIGTLHARAFHPNSEFHRKAFPVSISPWWEKRYAIDLEDPNCYLLKVSSPESSTTVLGLLSLRKYEADQRGAGIWSDLPPPPEVNHEAYEEMIRSMAHYREEFMAGQQHFCIDHFGVDAEYQGQGFGSKLLRKACEIADEERLGIFVEANANAETFYQRFGFKTRQKLVIPGGITECFLVRESR